MEFTVTTAYDLATMKAMARGLRKSIRKKHSKRSHRLGILVIVVGLTLVFSAFAWNLKTTITALAVAFITAALVWEDTINGYFAWKRGIPGLKTSVVTFRDQGYHSVTEVGESDFSYEIVKRLVQNGDYLIFVIGPSHGQVYDLKSLADCRKEFIEFLTEKTGISLEIV